MLLFQTVVFCARTISFEFDRSHPTRPSLTSVKKNLTTSKLIDLIFAEPTAPFREAFVSGKIQEILSQHGIPYFLDPYGNIVAGMKDKSEFMENARVGLLAHMDHPGFHVKRKVRKRVFECQWYGGAPFAQMRGARIRVYDEKNSFMSERGVIKNFPKEVSHREGIAFQIETKNDFDFSAGLFGAFDFPGLKRTGAGKTTRFISSRAADDLAGVVIGLGALIDIAPSKHAFCVFTRAEEVGFVGCLKVLENGLLNSNTFTISLEASRALTEAKPGKGPVLRIGDRSTLFHSYFSISFWKKALELAKADRQFKFQRRLMDGGSCEATALSLYDVPTTGLAVPLLNYHNQGVSGPAPEKIAEIDVELGRKLCAFFLKEFVPQESQTKAESKVALLKNMAQLEELLGPQIDLTN